MRSLKIIFSFIICAGLLGGVGYAIYSAITTQGSNVALSIEGEMWDIKDFVPDYEKYADGETIQLPMSDEELLEFDISKTGYTFDYWSYDASGDMPVENSAFVKKTGAQTIYLQLKRKDYKVYTIQLKLGYAENFEFKNFGDIEYYKQIANISGNVDDFAPQIISYEGRLTLQSYSSSEKGYEYVWLKWIGEGKCQKQNNVPVYYQGSQVITEDAVFVQCKMPKKYTVNYKYYDEKNSLKSFSSNTVVFNDTNDKIKIQGVGTESFAREGYLFDKYYIVNDLQQKMEVLSDQYMNIDILNFIGGDFASFNCIIEYTPKKYDINIVGYSPEGIILTNDIVEIDVTNKINYYSNLLSYLNNIMTSTSLLTRDFLVFQKFTYEDGTDIKQLDTQPASNITIHALYTIKTYFVNIELQLKNEKVSLNEDTRVAYRYNTAFPDADMITFDDALNQGINTQSYYIDEFVFSSYTVSREGSDDKDIVYNGYDLMSLSSLTNVVSDVTITINTEKYRFFVNYMDYGVTSDAKPLLHSRKEIIFDEETGLGVVDIEASLMMKDYTFGGWKLEDTEAYGNYSYLDYGYQLYKQNIKDDVVVFAEWYATDMSGQVSRYWSYQKDELNRTVVITAYNGSQERIAIPSTIMDSNIDYVVIGLGAGGVGNSVVSDNSNIKKVLIPTSVKHIYSYAFAKASPMDIRFVEAGSDVRDLEIHEFAFTASEKGLGVASVTLPNRVKSIAEGAFAYNTNIEMIALNASNGVYYTENYKVSELDMSTMQLVQKDVSVLYKVGELSGRELLHYCAGNGVSSYTIPSDVVRVCDYAFACSPHDLKFVSNLRNISIADDNALETIGKEAFAYLTSIDSIILHSLPNLSSVGIGDKTFYQSFYNANDNANKTNIKFKILMFDLNGATSIPNYFVTDSIYLMGLVLRNEENVTNIGERAFYNLGYKYIQNPSESNINYQDYYSSQYTYVRQGFISFMKEYFNKDDSFFAGLDNRLARDYMNEFLQSYVIFKPLNFVGVLAFYQTSLKVYTATDYIYIKGGDIPSQGMWGAKLYSLIKLQYNTRYTAYTKDIDTILFEGSFIESRALFGFQIVDMAIKFTDCTFGYDSSQTMFGSFTSFSIVDTDKNDEVFYNFEVIFTMSATSEMCKIPARTFENMNIENSNFYLIVDSSITDASIASKALHGVFCRTMYIENIESISTQAFGNANADSLGGDIKDSATEIYFKNCDFSLYEEVTSSTGGTNIVFRNLMFYECKTLQTVVFDSCSAVFTEYKNDLNDNAGDPNFNKFMRTNHLASISEEKDGTNLLKLTLTFDIDAVVGG